MATTKRLTAIFTLGNFEFKLSAASNASTAVATFSQKGNEPLEIDDLINNLGLLDAPVSTGVSLDQISLVYQKGNIGGSQYLCAADIGVNLDFIKGLPLVGEKLSAVDEPFGATLTALGRPMPPISAGRATVCHAPSTN